MHQNRTVEEMAKSVEESAKTVEKITVSVEWVFGSRPQNARLQIKREVSTPRFPRVFKIYVLPQREFSGFRRIEVLAERLGGADGLLTIAGQKEREGGIRTA